VLIPAIAVFALGLVALMRRNAADPGRQETAVPAAASAAGKGS
jgi:hypothetical protein